MSTKRKSIGNKTTESNKKIKGINEEKEEEQQQQLEQQTITRATPVVEEDINIAREKARQWHEQQMKLAGLRKNEENKTNSFESKYSSRKGRYSVSAIPSSLSSTSPTLPLSSISAPSIENKRSSRKSEILMSKSEQTSSQIRTRRSYLSTPNNNNNNNNNNSLGISHNIRENINESESESDNNFNNNNNNNRNKTSARKKKNDNTASLNTDNNNDNNNNDNNNKEFVEQENTVIISEPFTSELSSQNSSTSGPFSSTTPTQSPPSSPHPNIHSSLSPQKAPNSGFKTIEQRMNSVPPVLAPIISPTFPTIPEEPPVDQSWISAKNIIFLCLTIGVLATVALHTEYFLDFSRNIKSEMHRIEIIMVNEFGPSPFGMEYTSFLLVTGFVLTALFVTDH